MEGLAGSQCLDSTSAVDIHSAPPPLAGSDGGHSCKGPDLLVGSGFGWGRRAFGLERRVGDLRPCLLSFVWWWVEIVGVGGEVRFVGVVGVVGGLDAVALAQLFREMSANGVLRG